MKKTLCRGLIACVSLVALASCQDYEGGYDFEQIKKASYAKDFEKTFGTVDPNQDWSMASTITANVQTSENGKVAIYSENPANSNAKVLASFSGKTATFNAIKGYTQVYAMVFDDNNKVVAKGYYDIKDNQVVIGNNALTRATSSPSLIGLYDGAQDGEADGVLVSKAVNTTSLVPYPIEWYSGETLVEDKIHGCEYYVYDYTQFKNVSSAKTTVSNFYEVSTPDFSTQVERPLIEMYDLYYEYTNVNGEKKPGVFAEGVNHVTKYLGFNKEDVGLLPDAFVVSKGGEPVTMTIVGLGTKLPNDVGYFYYPKVNEADYLREDGTLDLDKVNKYVLIQNATYSGNPDMDNADAHLLYGVDDNMYEHYWNDSRFQETVKLAGKGEVKQKQVAWYPEALFETYDYATMNYKCTKIEVPFFGDDEDPMTSSVTPTYDFPADYVIGFFCIRTALAPTDYRHINVSSASVELNYFNTAPRAATFRYRGKTYLGLEDDQDFDLNDFLMELGGINEDDEDYTVPDITPEDDPQKDPDPAPEPETETIETETSWIYACEDLGGTFDYDFNDVVWAVVNKYEITRYKETKEPVGTPVFKSSCIRLLACGGTLPVQLFFDGKVVGGKEIHQQFGQPEANGYSANVSPSPVEIALSTTSAIVIDDTFNQKFTLKVENKDASSTYVTTPTRNENAAPQVLVLTGDWEWPKEGMPIDEAYKEFTNWTKDVTWSTWASQKTENSTVPRAH